MFRLSLATGTSLLYSCTFSSAQPNFFIKHNFVLIDSAVLYCSVVGKYNNDKHEEESRSCDIILAFSTK